MTTQARLLKAKDAAPLVGISAVRLYRLARDGGLPEGVVVRLSARAVRFSSAALERWLSGPVAVAPPAPAVPQPSNAVSRHVTCPTCRTDILWVETQGGTP